MSYNNLAIIISCEHANNFIPLTYASLFAQHAAKLNSHYGFDKGALDIAEFLYKNVRYNLPCEVFYAQTSRLLIDCNRSLHNRKCFSEFTQQLSSENKQQIITTYYTPYRASIEQQIRSYLQEYQLVLHLSQHSFTPILHDKPRTADIGLLYDPRRDNEKQFSHTWQHLLQSFGFKTRLNYPYRGTSDGLTTAMRKLFHDISYVGIEIEINQAIIENSKLLEQLKFSLLKSLFEVVNNRTGNLIIKGDNL